MGGLVPNLALFPISFGMEWGHLRLGRFPKLYHLFYLRAPLSRLYKFLHLAKICELDLGRPPPRYMKSVKRGSIKAVQKGGVRSNKRCSIRSVKNPLKRAQVGSTKTALSGSGKCSSTFF